MITQGQKQGARLDPKLGAPRKTAGVRSFHLAFHWSVSDWGAAVDMMVIRMVIVYIDHDSIDCLVEGEEPA